MLRSHAVAPSSTATALKQDLLHFINDVLPKTRGKSRDVMHVDGSTPLFESGLIDSLAIVQLIALVERATGRGIPPRVVVMKHFRTVDAICAAFAPGEEQSQSALALAAHRASSQYVNDLDRSELTP
jgi:acyl carrier protein